MNTKLKLTITITFLGLTAAGCVGNPIDSSAAGATLATPAVDATPARTLSGAPLTAHSGETVTGRDWNCPRCYK